MGYSMKKIKNLLLLLSVISSYPVFALRCGHQLVDLGDYKEDVIDKCGRPESIDVHIERRGARNFVGGSSNLIQRYQNGSSINYGQQQYVEIDVVVEEWIYNFGRRKLQQYLRFENGRLKEIKSLGRGD